MESIVHDRIAHVVASEDMPHFVPNDGAEGADEISPVGITGKTELFRDPDDTFSPATRLLSREIQQGKRCHLMT